MVRAVRSSRAVRFSGLVLGAAALAAAGLLAGGAPGQAGHASPGTALTAGSRYAARPAAGGIRHRAGALPVAGPLPVKDVAQATRLARPLRGVRRYLRTREGVAQIALFNKVTGRTYLLSGGPGTQYTASIVKADIMALWLWRYQSRTGTIPDNMPYSIRYLLQNMITMSDNVAATSLFYFPGGCTTLTLFNTLIPTRHTRVGCETPTYYGWGNTTTTAADQAAIVRTLALTTDDPAGPGAAGLNYGISTIQDVSQRIWANLALLQPAH